MSEFGCTRVQEQIAWGRPLGHEEQTHVLACAVCTKTALEYEKLDSGLKTHLDIAVPDAFAERVMQRIMRDAPVPAERLGWLDLVGARVAGWLQLRPVQIVTAAAGLLFTLGNLARFVFSVLMARTA